MLSNWLDTPAPDKGATSQDGTQEISEQSDPVIAPPSLDAPLGLALGGGAAKGWSHIGVFHALDEAGIRPDIITGTSIGAVVGGCYLAGRLDKLEEFARGLTRGRLFGLLDVSFSGSSLINGTRLTKLLKRYLNDIKIEDLDRPFMAVGTELSTGHEIWLRRGSLITAMQASYALPGVFSPVNVNGRLLVDGALVNPVPVSLTRALGARIVIAVNLSSDTFGRGTIVPNVHFEDDRLPASQPLEREAPAMGTLGTLKNLVFGNEEQGSPGISSVMFDAYTIIQDRITRSRLAGDPPDITIKPRLKDIGMFDFDQAEASIAAGYAATQKVIKELHELSDDLKS
ncbi:NTE family protein [Cohaesibacter sp. ES.047]|uniref:patatin-like phospholipase family protein n=1 Tax=Cohaesibacter sp. ES.047 TaxID=1798205 RepID=UPI000BB87A46|nr:patatin-like phospholipase family protein [Cohaesibacter sp. ES.047]SNY94174.1 NTE family protein [Cohaesibacter sp. ES.047]